MGNADFKTGLQSILMMLFMWTFVALPQIASANDFSTNGLSDVFIMERDADGTLVKVRVNRDNLKLETLITEIKKDIVSLEKSSNKDARSYLELVDISDWKSKDKANAEAVLNNLKTSKTSRYFDDAKLKEVAAKFQVKIFDRFNSSSLAAPSNPKFFYETEIAGQLIKLGLDLINANILPGGAYDLAFYILKRAIELDSQRRAFYQAALIYALENNLGEGLGLSEVEAAQVLSSIYESRIKWYEVWKTRNARRNWSDFGVEQFAKTVISADKRWNKYSKNYTNIGAALNYALYPASYKGESLIVNSNNKKSVRLNRPSVAMNFDNVEKLFVERVVLTMLEFAIELTPIPGIGQSGLQKVLRAHYFGQVKTEGALWAHYLESNDRAKAQVVIKQTVNPFIVKDFK